MKLKLERKTLQWHTDIVEAEMIDSFTLTKEVGEQIKSMVVIEKDIKLPKVEEVKYKIF